MWHNYTCTSIELNLKTQTFDYTCENLLAPHRNVSHYIVKPFCSISSHKKIFVFLMNDSTFLKELPFGLYSNWGKLLSIMFYQIIYWPFIKRLWTTTPFKRLSYSANIKIPPPPLKHYYLNMSYWTTCLMCDQRPVKMLFITISHVYYFTKAGKCIFSLCNFTSSICPGATKSRYRPGQRPALRIERFCIRNTYITQKYWFVKNFILWRQFRPQLSIFKNRIEILVYTIQRPAFSVTQINIRKQIEYLLNQATKCEKDAKYHLNVAFSITRYALNKFGFLNILM